MTSTGLSSGPGKARTCASSAAIVRRFLRDRHVVRMRLAQSRRRDLDEARTLHLGNRLGAAVAHRLPQPTDKLVHDLLERPLVRGAPLDPLGDELLDVLDVALE